MSNLRHSLDIGYCTRSTLKKSSAPQNDDDNSKLDVTNSPGPITRAKRKFLENTPVKNTSESNKETPNSGIKTKSASKNRNEDTDVNQCNQFPFVQLKDISDTLKRNSRRSLNPSFCQKSCPVDGQVTYEKVIELESKSYKKDLENNDISVDNKMNDLAVEDNQKTKKMINLEKSPKSNENIKCVKFAKDVKYINANKSTQAIKTHSISKQEKIVKQEGKSCKSVEHRLGEDSDECSPEKSKFFDMQLISADEFLKDIIKKEDSKDCDTSKTEKKLLNERGHVQPEQKASNKENQLKPSELKESRTKTQSECNPANVKEAEEISETLTNRCNSRENDNCLLVKPDLNVNARHSNDLNSSANVNLTKKNQADKNVKSVENPIDSRGCHELTNILTKINHPPQVGTPISSPKLVLQSRKTPDSPTEATQFPHDIQNNDSVQNSGKENVELQKITKENEDEYMVNKNENKVSEMKTQIESSRKVEIKPKQDSPTTKDSKKTQNVESTKNTIAITEFPTKVSQSPQETNNIDKEIKVASSSEIKSSDIDRSISTIEADKKPGSPTKVNFSPEDNRKTQNVEPKRNETIDTGSLTKSQYPQDTSENKEVLSSSEIMASALVQNSIAHQVDDSPSKVNHSSLSSNKGQCTEEVKNIDFKIDSPAKISQPPENIIDKKRSSIQINTSGLDTNDKIAHSRNEPDSESHIKETSQANSKVENNDLTKITECTSESDLSTKANHSPGVGKIINNVDVLSATCEIKKSETVSKTVNISKDSNSMLQEDTTAQQETKTPTRSTQTSNNDDLVKRTTTTAVSRTKPSAVVCKNVPLSENKSLDYEAAKSTLDENLSASPTVSTPPSQSGVNSNTAILSDEKSDITEKTSLQQEEIQPTIKVTGPNELINSVTDESRKTAQQVSKLLSPIKVIQNLQTGNTSQISELTKNSKDQSAVESDSPHTDSETNTQNEVVEANSTPIKSVVGSDSPHTDGEKNIQNEVVEANSATIKNSDEAKTDEGPVTSDSEITGSVEDEKLSKSSTDLSLVSDQVLDKITSPSSKESSTVCVKSTELEKSTTDQPESVPCLPRKSEESSNNQIRNEEQLIIELNSDCMKKKDRLEVIDESAEEISSDEDNIEVVKVSTDETNESDLEDDNVEEEVSVGDVSEEDVIDLEEEEEEEAKDDDEVGVNFGKYFLDDEAEEGEEAFDEGGGIILDDEEENESDNEIFFFKDFLDDEAVEYEEKSSENSDVYYDEEEESKNDLISSKDEESDDFRKRSFKSRRCSNRIESDEASDEEAVGTLGIEEDYVKIETAKPKKDSSWKKSLPQKSIKGNDWVISSLDESKRVNKTVENRQTRNGKFVVSKMTSKELEFPKKKSEPTKNILQAGNWCIREIGETYIDSIPAEDTNKFLKTLQENERKITKETSKTVTFLDNEEKRRVDCVESTNIAVKIKRFKADHHKESVTEIPEEDNLRNLENDRSDGFTATNFNVVTVGNVPSWTTSEEVKNAFLNKGFKDVANITEVYTDTDFKEMNFIKLTFTSMESYREALDSYGKIFLKGNPLFIIKDKTYEKEGITEKESQRKTAVEEIPNSVVKTKKKFQNSNQSLPKNHTNTTVGNVEIKQKSDQNIMTVKEDGKKDGKKLAGKSIKTTNKNINNVTSHNVENKPKFSCGIKCLGNARMNVTNVKEAFQSIGITDVRHVKRISFNRLAKVEFSSEESLAKALNSSGIVNIDGNPIIVQKIDKFFKQQKLLEVRTDDNNVTNPKEDNRNEEEKVIKTTEKNGDTDDDDDANTFGIQKEKNFSLIIKKLPPSVTKKNLKMKLNEYGIKDVEKIIINRSNNCRKYLDGVIIFNTKTYYLKALQAKHLLINGSKITFKEMELQSHCH